MKRKYTLFLLLLSLLSCQRDFDPILDSTICTAYFDLDAGDCFRNVISYKGAFIAGIPDALLPNYYLRISGFCYDSDYNLISKKVCLYDSIGIIPFTMEYLDSMQVYNFCFVADFVRNDSLLNYFGAWYYSHENSFETLFAHFTSADSLSQYNSLLYTTCSLRPNVPISLTLQPITCGGYVQLLNFSKFNKVSFTLSKHKSFSLLDPSQKNVYYWGTTEDFYPTPAMHSISIPITICAADARIGIKVNTCYVTESDGDSIKYYVNFTRRSPFLITMDCANLKQQPLIQYLQ